MTAALPTGELVLAHHPLITALPFVVPAFIVVGLIVAVVVRDRREERQESEARDE